MNLIDVSTRFAAEEKALDYLAAARWPNGVHCVACESDRVTKFSTKASTRKRFSKKQNAEVIVEVPARRLYQCQECRHQFSATVGTLFNDTHLPLNKWFMAIAILCDAKKSVSARQLARHLGITVKTAWYLNHRIRKAMEEGLGELFKGTVEADETYIGGKYDKRRARQRWDKEPVFGIIERGGKVKTWHIPQVNRTHVIGKLADTVSISADLVCTDQSPMYKRMPNGLKHEAVDHSRKEWVRGQVHTGSIDGYWGLLKRAIIGSFHQVSIKHLHRYLSEAEYRWNHGQEDLFALVVMRLLIQGAMEYKQLTAPVVAEPDIEIGDEPF